MHAENALRMTPGRTAILDVLGEKRRHQTAEEVFKEVRKKLPGIGLASVYRNLELFAEQGLVRIVRDGRGKRLRDQEPRAYVPGCM